MITQADQPTLDNIVRFLQSAHTHHAFLHYGSTVRGGVTEAGQDVDIFVLGPRDEDHSLFAVDAVWVDVSFATVQEGRQRLYSRYEHNNNYMLNALTGGRILLDGKGELSRLVVEANSLLAVGPPSLSRDLIEQRRRAITRGLEVTRRLTLRARNDVDCLRLAFIRLDQLFMNVFLMYWDLRGEWTSGFRQMLVGARESSLEIYDVWLVYSTASHFGEKFAALGTLVDLVFGSCRNPSL